MKRTWPSCIATAITALTVVQGVAQAPPIEWQRVLGGSHHDMGSDIEQTADDGFIVAGSSMSSDGDVPSNQGGKDLWLIKLNAVGDIEWSRTYGGSDYDVPSDVDQTTDGGFVAVGSTWSDDGDVTVHYGPDYENDLWIIRLDAEGNLLWERSLGGSNADGGLDVQQTPGGGFILSGYSGSSDHDVSGGHGSYDAWVVKVDDVGSIEWERCYGGTEFDVARDILLTPDSGYIVACESYSSDGDVADPHGTQDFWVLKLDAAGAIEWQQNYGGSSLDKPISIVPTSAGGYLLTGGTASNDGDVVGQHGGDDAWVVEIDEQGQLIWQQTIGGSANDGGLSAWPRSSGDLVVSGHGGSSDGDIPATHVPLDYCVVQLTSTGNLDWQMCLGGNGHELAYAIQETSDLGLITCGYTGSTDGDVAMNHGLEDVWIVKLGGLSTGSTSARIEDITIAPVPCTDRTRIIGLPPASSWSVELRSSMGALVRPVEKMNEQGELDVHDLPAGYYTVTVRSSWTSLTRSLVISR